MSQETYSEATVRQACSEEQKRKQVASRVQMFQHQGQHAALHAHRLTKDSATLLINYNMPGVLSQYHVCLYE